MTIHSLHEVLTGLRQQLQFWAWVGAAIAVVLPAGMGLAWLAGQVGGYGVRVLRRWRVRAEIEVR